MKIGWTGNRVNDMRTIFQIHAKNATVLLCMRACARVSLSLCLFAFLSLFLSVYLARSESFSRSLTLKGFCKPFCEHVERNLPTCLSLSPPPLSCAPRGFVPRLSLSLLVSFSLCLSQTHIGVLRPWLKGHVSCLKRMPIISRRAPVGGSIWHVCILDICTSILCYILYIYTHMDVSIYEYICIYIYA